MTLDGDCGENTSGLDTTTYCGVGIGDGSILSSGQLGSPNGAQINGSDIVNFYSTSTESSEPGIPITCSLVIEINGIFNPEDLVLQLGFIALGGADAVYSLSLIHI